VRKPLREHPVGKSSLRADNKYYSEIYSEDMELLKFAQNPVQYRMVFRLGLGSSEFLLFSGDRNWFIIASDGAIAWLINGSVTCGSTTRELVD
jgi:hypothetical protein